MKYKDKMYKKNQKSYTELVRMIKDEHLGEIRGEALKVLQKIYNTDKRFFVEKELQKDGYVKHMRILLDDWGEMEPFSIANNLDPIFEKSKKKIYLKKIIKTCRDIIAPYIHKLKIKNNTLEYEAHHNIPFNTILKKWLKSVGALNDENRLKMIYDDIINTGDRLTFQNVKLKNNWYNFHHKNCKISFLTKTDHAKITYSKK